MLGRRETGVVGREACLIGEGSLGRLGMRAKQGKYSRSSRGSQPYENRDCKVGKVGAEHLRKCR